jgi:hypothetical protein
MKLYDNHYKGNIDSFKLHVPLNESGKTTLKLPSSLNKVKQINLIDVEIPVSAYNVSHHNNTIYFTEYESAVDVNGTESVTLQTGQTQNVADVTFSMSTARFMARIAPGTYTSSQYVLALQNAMNFGYTYLDGTSSTAFGALQTSPQNTYKVHFDSIAGKIIIAAGTFTGEPGSTFTRTANETVAFSIRPASPSLDEKEPVIDGVRLNPLRIRWADTYGGNPVGPEYNTDLYDMAGRVLFVYRDADHGLMPGDQVMLRGGPSPSSDLSDASLSTHDGTGMTTTGHVVYVNGRSVHVMPTDGIWKTTKTVDGVDYLRMVQVQSMTLLDGTQDMKTTAHLGMSSTDVRHGLVRNVRFMTGTQVDFEYKIYANAAKGFFEFVSSGLEGDLPVIHNGTSIMPLEHHLLGAGSHVHIKDKNNSYNNTTSVDSAQDTTDGIPRLTVTTPLTINVLDFDFVAESIIPSTVNNNNSVVGSSTVRCSQKLDLTRDYRVIFIELIARGLGPLGSIRIAPKCDKVFFARSQLEENNDSIEFNHLSATGIYTMNYPTDLKEISLEIYNEKGEVINKEGVKASVFLEFIHGVC